MNFEIVTDSSANLPLDIIESQNIHILSLSYYLNEVEYKSYEKGKKNDLTQFYETLRKKGSARTSLVNIQAARDLLEDIAKQGKDILYIGFSSALSGTYQSVCLAVEDLKESYPEVKMICVDTLSATLGQGILVYYATKLREDGVKIEDVASWLEENTQRVNHWFSVDDLFYLHRGGRLSAASAVFGSALNIKPIMNVTPEGKLAPYDKVRGRKKVLKQLAALTEERIENPEEAIVGIAHGDCPEDANFIIEQLKANTAIKNFVVAEMEPVIGTHTGPGIIGVFFLGKVRE